MVLRHTHISFAHCYKNQAGMSDECEISAERFKADNDLEAGNKCLDASSKAEVLFTT